MYNAPFPTFVEEVNVNTVFRESHLLIKYILSTCVIMNTISGSSLILSWKKMSSCNLTLCINYKSKVTTAIY